MDYIPISDILVNELIKALLRKAFRHFKKQLGLMDVIKALDRRRKALKKFRTKG